MPTLAEILKQLKEESAFDSYGHFTLDKKKAREKMKKYQLISPYYYVLEIIQAAVASGAKKIDVYIDSDDSIFTFDGEIYTLEDLENIYSSLFVSQKDISLDRFRELAIGINSALVLNPQYIRVVSGKGKKGAELLCRPPSEEKIKPIAISTSGTKVHVKDRISIRVATRFLSKYIARRMPTEGKILKDRCYLCRIPIYINKDHINPPKSPLLENVLCSIPLKFKHGWGVIGISKLPIKLSQLTFLKWGVIITKKNLHIPPFPIIGIIEANHLIKNASQSDIVENEKYTEIIRLIEDKVDDLIIELSNVYPTFVEQEDYTSLRTSHKILLQAIEKKFRLSKYKKNPTPLLKSLASIKLFETTELKKISLEELILQMDKIGYVPYSTKHFDFPHPQGFKVLYIGNEQQKSLMNRIFFGKTKNVENEFFAKYTREKNIKKWKENKKEALSLVFTRFKKRIKEDEIEGEIGVPPKEPQNSCTIAFYKEMGKIVDKNIDIHSLPFEGVVNNDNLKPVFTWDDLEIDDEFRRTVEILIKNTPALFLDVAKSYEEDPEDKEIYRQYLIKYINFVLSVSKSKRITAKIISLVSGKKSTGRIATFFINPPDIHLSSTFKEIKLFKTVRNNYVSLKDLEKLLKQYHFIPYITKEDHGPQMFEGEIIISTHGEVEVLQKYFEWKNLKNYEWKLAEERSILKGIKDKQPEEPVLSEKAIEKVAFDIDGAVGEIGILEESSYSYRYVSSKIISSASVVAKILKYNRFITTHNFNFPIRGVKVVVNYNPISVDPHWQHISEDEEFDSLKKRIKAALYLLAEKIVDQYSKYTPKERIVIDRFLFQFISYFFSPIDTHTKDTKINPLFKKILNLKIIEDIKGERLSLADLLEERKKHGKVAYTKNKVLNADLKGRRVCLIPHDVETNFKTILGGLVDDVEEYLRKEKASRLAKLSRPIKEAKVDKDQVINWTEIKDKELQIEGEIGLFRFYTPQHGSFSSISLLKEKRFICTKLLPLKATIKGVINCDHLKVSPSWQSIIPNRHYDQIKALVEAHTDLLMEDLLEKYNNLTEADKKVANLHIITYIFNVADSFNRILQLPEDTIEGKLARMKIIRVLGKENTSIYDIAKRYQENQRIYYVPLWSSAKPMDTKKHILVLNEDTLSLFKRLFFHFQDYSQDLAIDEIARKNLRKPKIRSLKVEDDYLVKVSINKEGIEGELALPSKLPSSKMILFTYKKIPIVNKFLYSRSIVFGILNSDSFELNRTCDDVVLFTREERAIMDGIYRLYSELVLLYPKIKDTPSGEVARHILLDFYYEQKKVPAKYYIMDDELKESIEELPLIPASYGRFVSIKVVLDQVERRGFVKFVHSGKGENVLDEEVILELEKFDFYYNFLVKLLGKDKLKYHFHLPKSEDILKHIGIKKQETIEPKIQKQHKTKPSSPKPPQKTTPSYKPKPTPISKAKPKEIQDSYSYITPEEELLRAIKREFRIIREWGAAHLRHRGRGAISYISKIKPYKLSENIITNMKIESLKGEKAILFNKRKEEVTINSSHPLVKTIMDGFKKYPPLIYYLISIIYSTINRQLKEITDEDEMRFQMVMLDNLLQYNILKR